jgi:hypothetical protein
MAPRRARLRLELMYAPLALCVQPGGGGAVDAMRSADRRLLLLGQ